MKNILAAFGLCALLWSGAVCAERPIIIKFSHVVANDTPKGLAAKYFRKKAEEYTQGRVRVQVYANSTLYKDNEEMAALQRGSVQMLAPSLARFGGLGIREFELFNLPYLFDSYAQVHRVTEGPIGKSILRKLEPKGIQGLAYWDNGFRSFSANTPIHVPEDLRGKRMRVQNSKVLEAEMRALGAIPEMLTFSDVYKALQKGMLDGTENPPSNMYTQKIYEVQKYYTLTEHGYLGYAVIVNKRFWENLPQTIRDQLQKALDEATTYENRIAERYNTHDLDLIRKSGKTVVYAPNAQEQSAFKSALMPIHKEMASRIGPALLESVYQTLAVPKAP